MILNQENIDFIRQGQYAFGEYVLGHNEPNATNINAARALNCVYLRPSFNMQRGHELLHLQTNNIILRRKLTPMLLTTSIIKQVHALAKLEKFQMVLK